MYQGELELEAELENLMGILEESDLELEGEMPAPADPTLSRGPVFDVACTGCADRGCRVLLRQAILEAIRLARSAADKLDAAMSLDPGHRVGDPEETARLFKAFFCDDPSTPVPWAKGPSGAIVAARLRAVAKELDGGLRIIFVCQDTRDDCADPGCCSQDDYAIAFPRKPSQPAATVFLCAKFWDARPLDELDNKALRGLDDPRLQLVDRRFLGLPEADRRAAIIIHELLHVLFDLEDDAAKARRFDAHCYAAFVLRVNGFGGDPTAVRQCFTVPCAFRI